MSTNAITRREVSYYVVAKKKINKNIDGDSLKIRFIKLPKARAYAMELYNMNNLKSLTNSNGVSLPL